MKLVRRFNDSVHAVAVAEMGDKDKLLVLEEMVDLCL